ncbi:DUF445 domain-containing protein [Facilibium subflavum]|uniref:DUF445 domain-containing protein n=1 Tax=Facilibium subflavum TaxID=2219058 RepID=UPI000E655024|nr:DUF445 domain-containing protein [Facilibium subflavum]
MINKSLVTNVIALILSILGIILADTHLKAVGFYALSGALTNWLAIIMLFDKIPFVYGSGVIPKQFEGFKKAIKNMMLTQFFNEKNVQQFLLGTLHLDHKILQSKMSELIDYDQLFDKFVDTIMSSQFGGMVESFLGGVQAIEPMRDSFKQKMHDALYEMLESDKAQAGIKSLMGAVDSQFIADKLEKMIDARLSQLTPKMVKKIIQDMIRKHLGWLVIWGGIFGGIIGLIASFLS